VETILVIHDLLRAIGFERFTVHVNDRAILNGLLENVDLPTRRPMCCGRSINWQRSAPSE